MTPGSEVPGRFLMVYSTVGYCTFSIPPYVLQNLELDIRLQHVWLLQATWSSGRDVDDSVG